MKDHVRYSRARDQLYHLKVAFRILDEDIPQKRRTPELRQALDMLQTIVDATCKCFERGHILEVLVNEYVPNVLPGFKDIIAQMQEHARYDGDPPEAYADVDE